MIEASAKLKPHYTSHAMLTALVTVEKEIPFPFKGEIYDAIFELDYKPGLYGFTSQEKRDRFVALMNRSHIEHKPCVAVSLQQL